LKNCFCWSTARTFFSFPVLESSQKGTVDILKHTMPRRKSFVFGDNQHRFRSRKLPFQKDCIGRQHNVHGLLGAILSKIARRKANETQTTFPVAEENEFSRVGLTELRLW
jgi:hypothetical protein